MGARAEGGGGGQAFGQRVRRRWTASKMCARDRGTSPAFCPPVPRDVSATRVGRPRRGRRSRPTAQGSVCVGPDPADSGTAGVAFEGRGEAWGGWGQSLGFSPCRLRRSRGCCACVVRQGVARADRHSNGTAWGESVPQPQQESQDATRRNKTQSATRRNKTQQAEASSNKPQLTRVPRGHVRHDGAYG